MRKTFSLCDYKEVPKESHHAPQHFHFLPLDMMSRDWHRDVAMTFQQWEGCQRHHSRISESVRQLPPYECYPTWVAKPSKLAVIPSSPHWTHTLLPASRGEVGSIIYFPSPLKGWFCILLSPTEYDGNDTPPVSSRTSLKEGLPLSEMSYQVRSLHTRRLSCSEEAQASHVRPHGERGPKPSTNYPSTPAGAPDMWVIKLCWTF